MEKVKIKTAGIERANKNCTGMEQCIKELQKLQESFAGPWDVVAMSVELRQERVGYKIQDTTRCVCVWNGRSEGGNMVV